jgi:hypothetical protein
MEQARSVSCIVIANLISSAIQGGAVIALRAIPRMFGWRLVSAQSHETAGIIGLMKKLSFCTEGRGIANTMPHGLIFGWGFAAYISGNGNEKTVAFVCSPKMLNVFKDGVEETAEVRPKKVPLICNISGDASHTYYRESGSLWCPLQARQEQTAIVELAEKMASQSKRVSKYGMTMLVSGPPGTGKSSIAVMLAAAVDGTIFKLKEVYIDLNCVFSDISRDTPTVILIDEFDVLYQQAGKQAKKWLCDLLDDIDGRSDVFCVLTTNKTFAQLEKVMRPRRFAKPDMAPVRFGRIHMYATLGGENDFLRPSLMPRDYASAFLERFGIRMEGAIV